LTELLDVMVAKDPEYYEEAEKRTKLALLKHHLFVGHSNHRGLSDVVNTKIIEPIPSLQKRSVVPLGTSSESNWLVLDGRGLTTILLLLLFLYYFCIFWGFGVPLFYAAMYSPSQTYVGSHRIVGNPAFFGGPRVMR